MLINGRVWALVSPVDEAARQIDLVLRTMGAVASEFIQAGFDCTLETVLPDLAQLRTLLSALPGGDAQLVVLAPSIESCRARNDLREASERFDFDGYETLQRTMRSEFDGVGWWVDTTELTAVETADLILSEPSQGIVLEAKLDPARGSSPEK